MQKQRLVGIEQTNQVDISAPNRSAFRPLMRRPLDLGLLGPTPERSTPVGPSPARSGSVKAVDMLRRGASVGVAVVAPVDGAPGP
jgi:hypothetical protein